MHVCNQVDDVHSIQAPASNASTHKRRTQLPSVHLQPPCLASWCTVQAVPSIHCRLWKEAPDVGWVTSNICQPATCTTHSLGKVVRCISLLRTCAHTHCLVLRVAGGIIYVQNASPSGPAAWLMAEVADRLLRWIEDDFQHTQAHHISTACCYIDQVLFFVLLWLCPSHGVTV